MFHFVFALCLSFGHSGVIVVFKATTAPPETPSSAVITIQVSKTFISFVLVVAKFDSLFFFLFSASLSVRPEPIVKTVFKLQVRCHFFLNSTPTAVATTCCFSPSRLTGLLFLDNCFLVSHNLIFPPFLI